MCRIIIFNGYTHFDLTSTMSHYRYIIYCLYIYIYINRHDRSSRVSSIFHLQIIYDALQNKVNTHAISISTENAL